MTAHEEYVDIFAFDLEFGCHQYRKASPCIENTGILASHTLFSSNEIFRALQALNLFIPAFTSLCHSI